MNCKPVIMTFALLGLTILLSSCATHALWDATDPDLWAEAPKSTISTNDLAAKGVQYLVDAHTGDIFIPKSQLHKLGDYTIRVLATPITVTLDAVAVAGGITITCGAILLSNMPSATSSPTDNWGRPVDETTGKPVPGVYPIKPSRISPPILYPPGTFDKQ